MREIGGGVLGKSLAYYIQFDAFGLSSQTGCRFTVSEFKGSYVMDVLCCSLANLTSILMHIIYLF